MRISIITATYNSEKTLHDTLLSLEKQTYDDIEYIIIDGASKDNTLFVVKNCKRVTKIISEPDRGIYDALNKGIEVATGDVIGFLHSDDMLAYDNAITDVAKTFSIQVAMQFMVIWSTFLRLTRPNVFAYGKVEHSAARKYF